MGSLIELVGRVSGLMNAITDSDGDVSALEQELRGLIVAEENKVSAVGLVLDRMEKSAASLQDEAELLMASAARVRREQERLRRYVLATMQANGVKQLKSPVVTFSVVAPRNSVRIYDEPAVPNNFRLAPKTPPPDKARIKKALTEGVAVPGAELVEGGESLMVRYATSKATVVEESGS